MDNDDAWARFCKAENDYFDFVNCAQNWLQDRKRTNREKLYWHERVTRRLYAFHRARPDLSQLQLEDLLRQNKRRTYLVTVPFPRWCFLYGFGLSFGKQATSSLDQYLYLCMAQFQDFYKEQLKMLGHETRERGRGGVWFPRPPKKHNRSFLPRAGFAIHQENGVYGGRSTWSILTRLRGRSSGQPSMQTCNLCLKRWWDMKCCARCGSVHYCSKDCQRADWGFHRTRCKPRDSRG